MNAHQRVFGKWPLHQPDMLDTVDQALEGMRLKTGDVGRKRGRCNRLHQYFRSSAIFRKLGDRQNRQAVFSGKDLQIRPARHFAIITHDFADHGCGIKPGKTRKIDRALRVTIANKHATHFPRAAENMCPGDTISAGDRMRIGGGGNGASSFCRRKYRW